MHEVMSISQSASSRKITPKQAITIDAVQRNGSYTYAMYVPKSGTEAVLYELLIGMANLCLDSRL